MIGTNSATKTNFKNAKGTPATPLVVKFTTAAMGATAPVGVPRETQITAIKQLRDAIEHHYSYRDVHIVDWPAAWSEFEPRLKNARSAREFAVIAGEMLATTQDPHVWLIQDARVNSGGDETIAREFAGCFVRQRAMYARHVNLDSASPTGFTRPTDRWLEPTPNRPAYAGRVAVLMGPANMSSAEAFLLMMKQVPGCRLVGERSYGASGNPQPHVLANGVTVLLPSWQAMLPDGTVFEKRGIEPDVTVATSPAELARRDPVIEKAIALLQE